MKLKVVVLVLCLVQLCSGYKILGIFSHPGKSHFDTFEPYLLELAKRGHEVTVISIFPQKTPTPRYTDVSLAGVVPVFKSYVDVNDIPRWRFFKYLGPIMTGYFLSDTCNGLGAKVIQDFHRQNHTFDLVVTEMFATDCFLGLLTKIEAPIVAVSSCTLLPWLNGRFGNPDNPSYIPVPFLDYSDRLGFLQRVENTFMWAWSRIAHDILMDYLGNSLMRKHLGKNTPDSIEIANKASLILVNTHFSLNLPRPHPPNVIEVAGIHLQPHKKIPEHIEKFLNESNDGVILVSFGSTIKGNTFPPAQLSAFKKVLSRLPQRVLWKWDIGDMEDKPKNVLLQKWLPQYDVLCHPKTKAFITHSGLLGTIEGVTCGVPMISMPQFGDQPTNAAALQAVGGGVVVDFKTATEDDLSKALKKVLDPKFKEQSKNLSSRFRDRQVQPMDSAIYWTEYVVKHGGAPHLRPASVDLPFYQYLLLDVLAFYATIGLLLLIINYYIWKSFLRLIFGQRPKSKKD